MNITLNRYNRPVNINPSFSLEHVMNGSAAGYDSVKELKLSIIQSQSGFKAIGKEWDELVGVSGIDVFSTFPFMQLWWRYFGRHTNRKLYIIVLRSSGKIVAIAPFYVGLTKIGDMVIHRRLSLMGCGTNRNESLGFSDTYGYYDFQDIICHPFYAEKAARVIYGHLKQNEPGFQKIRFHNISETSFVKTKLLPLFEGESASSAVTKSDVCPYIAVPASFELFSKPLNSGIRRRFRKTLNAVNHPDGFTVEPVVSISAVEKATEELINLHQERWNRLGYPGNFGDKRFAELFKNLVMEAHKRGWLWFKVAKAGDQICALRMALYYNARYYDHISAYDDASPVASKRPGYALLLLLIQDAIASRGKSTELMRGGEPYKFELTSNYRTNWNISVRGNSSSVMKIIDLILEKMSQAYVSVTSEFALLKVQRQLHGTAGMIISYLAFRTQKIREKLLAGINKNKIKNYIQ